MGTGRMTCYFSSRAGGALAWSARAPRSSDVIRSGSGRATRAWRAETRAIPDFQRGGRPPQGGGWATPDAELRIVWSLVIKGIAAASATAT